MQTTRFTPRPRAARITLGGRSILATIMNPTALLKLTCGRDRLGAAAPVPAPANFPPSEPAAGCFSGPQLKIKSLTTMNPARSLLIFATLLAAILVTNSAPAATNTWNGPGLTGNWDTSGNNWAGTPAGTPWAAQGNSALFDTSNNVVTVSTSISVDNWSIGSSGNRVTLNAGVTITENFANANFLIFGSGHTSTNDGNILTINGTFNFGHATASDYFRLGSDNASSGSSYNGIAVNTNGTLRHVTATNGTHDDEVGTYAGANYNYMDINGGTFDRQVTGSKFYVGVQGSSNYMTIRNGGTLSGGQSMPTIWALPYGNSELHIGTGGSFNHVDVTGPNSVARVAQLLTVGNATNATDNYLKVENGGAFWGGFVNTGGLIGGSAGADSNYVQVTGINSTLNLHNRNGVARFFTIGAVGTTANSNHLDVFSGATANLSCGVILGGSNSKFNLGDGAGTSTAKIGNGALTNLVYLSVASAQLNFNSGKLMSLSNGIPLVTGPGTVNLNGPATIDTSTYTNSIDSVITGTGSLTITNLGRGKLTLSSNNTYSGDTTISAGTLALSGSGSVHSSANLIVSSGATFDVSGVTTPPYSLTSGQTLKGNGGVKGTVIVASGATVAPGTSIGTLYFTNAPTLSGTVLMEINRAASPNADKLVLVATGGTLTNGGTLTITNTGGTLQSGDTFDLFDADHLAGSFATINTPTLPSGLAWDTSRLTIDGTIKVIGTPAVTATDATYVRAPGLSLKIPIAAIASDPAHPPVSVQSLGTSGQGATLSFNSTYIFYTPANNNNDSFTYTVQNSVGDTASATLTVNVVAAGGFARTITVSAGTAAVKFFGIPGLQYDVQRTTSLTEPVTWTTLTSGSPLSPGADGSFTHTDASAPNGTAYYRCLQH